MLTGPYQTPTALVKEPLMAFFCVILAPILFLTGAALIALQFIPAFEPGTADEIAAYQFSWLMSCLGMAAWFGLMSVWSNAIGAGPFAGKMRTEPNWVAIGLISGPLILIVPTMIVSSFMTEPGWQYNQEVNEAIFEPQNWSLAYVFVAVIMAPIVEEMAFRGVAMGAILARGFSPVAAVTVSSLAFACSHQQYSPEAMFIVFLSGVGFGVLRLMRKTVLVPIIAHMAANATVLSLSWVAANPPT